MDRRLHTPLIHLRSGPIIDRRASNHERRTYPEGHAGPHGLRARGWVDRRTGERFAHGVGERFGSTDRRAPGQVGRRVCPKGFRFQRRKNGENMGVGRRSGHRTNRRHYPAGTIAERETRPPVERRVRAEAKRQLDDLCAPLFGPSVRHRDGDRRAPDHERREFEARRRGLPNWSSWRRRLTDCAVISHEEAERRKAQNSNKARRQGPTDRRDFEDRGRLVYFGTPMAPKFPVHPAVFPDHPVWPVHRRVVTVGGPNWGKTAPEPDDRVPGRSSSRRSHKLGRRNGFRRDRRKSGRRVSSERRKVEVDKRIIRRRKPSDLPRFATTGRRKAAKERRTHDAPGKKLARQMPGLFGGPLTREKLDALVRELSAPTSFLPTGRVVRSPSSIKIEGKERRKAERRDHQRANTGFHARRVGLVEDRRRPRTLQVLRLEDDSNVRQGSAGRDRLSPARSTPEPRATKRVSRLAQGKAQDLRRTPGEE